MTNKIETSNHLLSYHDCYLAYTSDNPISEKSHYYGFSAKETKKIFGFELACEDLPNSYSSATQYIADNNINKKLPVDFKTMLINNIDVLVVHKVSEKIGYGVSSASQIEKGTIVAEYIGEKIPIFNKSKDSTYLFFTNDGTYVDSKDYGNVARFITHCPNSHDYEMVMTANLAAVVLPKSKDFNTVFFITLRDINEFELLCYDYGNKYDHKNGLELLNSKTYLPIEEL